MSTKEDLQKFYDANASKYHRTRQKHRADSQYIINEINNSESKKVRILELGCGAGRFASYLNENCKKKFNYIWVDLSSKLLEHAKSDNPKMKFECSDMSIFVTKQDQESRDYIILTASFQHIPNYHERLFLMKNFYKMLNYNGKVIMLNWALSDWFVNKYLKQVLQALIKSVITFWKKDKRDVMVPWKSGKTTYYRYYHLFGLKELKKLSLLSWFVVDKLTYLDKKGNEINKVNSANNSLLVACKKIFK